nr:type II secretion system F family protein [Coprobacillus cateniformis]
MFHDYMVHLLKVGEVSGYIDDVMESLGAYYLRMDDMTSQLQQALTYPIILFIMMFVVVGVVVFQVLPIFENVLMSLGSHLSSFASRFMNFGQIFSMLGFMILGIFMIMIISFYVYAKKSHQDIMVMFVQKSWITKKIANHMNHAQLTYALSLFVSSGYDLQEAVHYTIELVDNSQLQNQLKQCYHDLEQGVSFVDAVSQHQIYKGMKLNMIQIGFQTGQVDAVMKTLSNHYQDEVSQSIAHFLNIIEPAIVTFLSVIVGVVLLSVMLPLVSIMSSL